MASRRTIHHDSQAGWMLPMTTRDALSRSLDQSHDPDRHTAVPAAALPPSGSWTSQAACLESDPDLFFPIGSSGPALRQTAQAKAVCARCPVRADCLGYALSTRQDAGIWGGTSEEERREIRMAEVPAQSPRRQD